MQKQPVLTIQSDWEKSILHINKTVWVACKFLNQPSCFAKVQSQGIGLPTCDSDEFSIAYPSRGRLIYVKHDPSGLSTSFLAPFRLLRIHGKNGIASLDVGESGFAVSSDVTENIVVWDNATGERKQTLTGHINTVNVCKFFPSGTVVVSGGMDMRLKIWSAESGVCPVTLIGHTRPISGVAIIDRGRNIISVSKDGSARLWDCGQSMCIRIIVQTNDVFNCCAIGQVPDGTETATPTNGREICTEDKILLVGSEEGRIFGTVVSTNQTIFTQNLESSINTIQYLTKESFVSGLQNGQIIFHCLKSGTAIRMIEESNSPVLSSAVISEEHVFIGRNDGTVTLISSNPVNDFRMQLTGSDCDPITDIKYSGNCVYVGCRDGFIRVYQISDIISNGKHRYPSE